MDREIHIIHIKRPFHYLVLNLSLELAIRTAGFMLNAKLNSTCQMQRLLKVNVLSNIQMLVNGDIK